MNPQEELEEAQRKHQAAIRSPESAELREKIKRAEAELTRLKAEHITLMAESLTEVREKKYRRKKWLKAWGQFDNSAFLTRSGYDSAGDPAPRLAFIRTRGQFAELHIRYPRPPKSFGAVLGTSTPDPLIVRIAEWRGCDPFPGMAELQRLADIYLLKDGWYLEEPKVDALEMMALKLEGV